MTVVVTWSEAPIEGTVAVSESLGPDVRRLVVETDAPYPFRAGQHVALRFEGEGPLDSYYSYASAMRPGPPHAFELVVGRGTQGTPEVPVGRRIVLSVPRGTAIYERVASERPLLLVATGTGIAPLRALVQEVLALRAPPAVTLLHGCRTETDRLFAAEFLALEDAGRIRYRPVLSRPPSEYAGLRGHVQDHVASHFEPGAFGVVCGSRAMVEDVVRVLTTHGVQTGDYFAEGYG